MKLTVLLFYMFFNFFCIAQNQYALQLYNEGVQLYNKQKFEKANKFFSKSIDLEKNKDTYFARALCYGKMANKNGYCEDLATASSKGEKKATILFLKSCGTIDSVYSKLEQHFTKTVILSRTVTYTLSDSSKFSFTQKYASQQSDSLQTNSVMASRDSTVAEEPAEFPGGLDAMKDFMRANIVFPSSALKDIRVTSDKVLVEFTVFKDGTIHDIIVLNGLPGFPECELEATRVIAIMPRWTPAYINGLPVKCRISLPISFKFDKGNK